VPPTTASALLLLVAFVLPGFVAEAIAQRTRLQRSNRDSLERLLWALYYSSWVYLVLGVGASAIAFADGRNLTLGSLRSEGNGHHSVFAVTALGAVVVLVIPFLVVVAGQVWRDRWLKPVRGLTWKLLGGLPGHQTPTAWDHAFGLNEGWLVRVTMRDERVLGGRWVLPSFAAYSGHGGDLYLAQLWPLAGDDDWFLGAPMPNTKGVWLSGKDIVSIEFYTPAEYEDS
jgi:hypothetical protein